MTSQLVFRRPALANAQAGLLGETIKTIPELIHFHARANPDYVFCMQSDFSGDGQDEEFRDVTYADLEKAVLACQASIVDTIGQTDLPKRDGQGNIVKRAPIALLMESDLSILLYLFSLFGLGIPIVLLSVRLSPLAIESLIAETGASTIYASPRYGLLAKTVQDQLEQAQYQLELHVRQSHKLFLDAPKNISSRVYLDTHYMEHGDRDVLILHSSGTTGLPKAIRQSHGYILNYLMCYDFSDAECYRLNLTSLPLYHGFGLLAPLISMSIGKTLIIPSSSLHTGAQVAPHLKRFKLGSFMTVPVILQELVELEDPEIIEVLRNLDFVACAGGTLKESVGDRLASFGVKILNSYGNTEAGPLSVLYAPAADHDWHWFTLRNDMGIKVAQEDGSSDQRRNHRFRLEVTPPGWTHTFEMQDSFAMNPKDATKRQFRPLERTDDVIVLKNGEKVLPYNLESILAEHEDVRGAVVFGNGQSQLGVLVEPRQTLDNPESLSRFKESLLLSLSEAGDLIDAHARIVFPEAIVVLGNGKNLPRSDKGALLRKASCEMHQQEIETAYELLDNIVVDTDTAVILKGDIEENLKQLIKSQILRAGQSQELTPSTDLFELGIDSLQAMQLRRILFSSLVAESGDRDTVSEMMPSSFVYMNPTISQMTQRLIGKLDLQKPTSRDEAVRQLVEEYTVNIGDERPDGIDGAVVLLTGASGGLGSHILAQLAARDSVKRIICMNRPSMLSPDPYIRQHSCSSEKGADVPDDLRNKIEVLDTNLSLPQFGLAEAVYSQLAASVTHIVHNAWPLDFNRQLSSFRPQFQVLSNLIRFSVAAKERQPSRGDNALVDLLFVSSISVVGAHSHVDANHGPVIVPESPASSAEHTLTLGYAEAKLVCEMMLRNAAQAGIVNGVITRMGQIAGATSNGYWNTSEHIPTLLQTSARMGALPQIEGTLSWIPLDIAARAVTDILLSPSANTHPVYHIENPQRQPWESVLLPISRTLSLPLVPYSDWLGKLRDQTRLPDSDEKKDHKTEPPHEGSHRSHELLGFFENWFERMASGSLVLGMENATRVSRALAEMDVVRPELLGRYVEYWRVKGLFPG